MRVKLIVRSIMRVLPLLLIFSQAHSATESFNGRVTVNGANNSSVSAYFNIIHNNNVSLGQTSGGQYMRMVYTRLPGTSSSYISINAVAIPVSDPTAAEVSWGCFIDSTSVQSGANSSYYFFKRAVLHASEGKTIAVARNTYNQCTTVNLFVDTQYQH